MSEATSTNRQRQPWRRRRNAATVAVLIVVSAVVMVLRPAAPSPDPARMRQAVDLMHVHSGWVPGLHTGRLKSALVWLENRARRRSAAFVGRRVRSV
jgi:hypothetical protein